MTNSGWLARAKHCTVIQILYRGYSVLKDAGRWVEGRWALGGRALQAARRVGAGRSGRAGVRSRRGEVSGRRAGRQVRGRAGHARQGRYWARGACGAQALCARPCTAWAWPGRWMGVLAGPAGLVLVHSAPGSVLARFLDPVRLGIFLSHQMNTVHYEIKFFRKK